jgi:hypothetical protein
VLELLEPHSLILRLRACNFVTKIR